MSIKSISDKTMTAGGNKPCGETKEITRKAKRGETYPLPATKAGGQIMKKDYHTCNEDVLCDECKKKEDGRC